MLLFKMLSIHIITVWFHLSQALPLSLTAHCPNLDLEEIFLPLAKPRVGKGFVAVKTPLGWGLQQKTHHHSQKYSNFKLKLQFPAWQQHVEQPGGKQNQKDLKM